MAIVLSANPGKREAEAARLVTALEELNFEDPAIRELAARFQEQARFVGSTKAEVNNDGDLGATDSGDHDEASTAEAGTGDAESGTDLSLEALKTLETLKASFASSPNLHNGVTWEDAEKALRKSPESFQKLARLIARGGEPTVTGEENGEIMFDEVSADCAGTKNIVYDKAAQEGITCNGNAVDIAGEMGVKPIARNRYEALRDKVEGLDVSTWSWVFTDEATRECDEALHGDYGYVNEGDVRIHNEEGGVRCSFGVKKT